MELTEIMQTVVRAGGFENKTAPEIVLFVIGLIGAISIAIFSLPQIIRIVKTKDTASVPAIMFCILSFGSLCFFIQGLVTMALNGSESLADMLPMTLANFTSFAISTTVLGFKFIYRFRAKKLKMTEKQYCEYLAKKNKKGKK